MTLRTLVLLVALCPPVVPRAASAEAPPSVRVTVRVYDTGVLDPGLKSGALHVAARALSAAHIVVRWRECPRAGVTPVCESPGAAEFVLRVVRSTIRHHDDGLPLGDTFVDTAAGAAVLATVYVDRVSRVAAAADVDPAALLGYAIAHEIGHLLMASTDHSESGLMRSVWRAAELRAGRAADWAFTEADIATIAGRVAPLHGTR